MSSIAGVAGFPQLIGNARSHSGMVLMQVYSAQFVGHAIHHEAALRVKIKVAEADFHCLSINDIALRVYKLCRKPIEIGNRSRPRIDSGESSLSVVIYFAHRFPSCVFQNIVMPVARRVIFSRQGEHAFASDIVG